jgi:hypothetical protein
VQTLGNHEFDWGADALHKYVTSLQHPVLSCNLRANGHPLKDHVSCYITRFVRGVKVGATCLSARVAHVCVFPMTDCLPAGGSSTQQPALVLLFEHG